MCIGALRHFFITPGRQHRACLLLLGDPLCKLVLGCISGRLGLLFIALLVFHLLRWSMATQTTLHRLDVGRGGFLFVHDDSWKTGHTVGHVDGSFLFALISI